MLSFLLYTKLTKGRQCIADVWISVSLHLSLFRFFLACTHSVPLLLIPPVSVFHLFRDLLLSVSILVRCPFLEVLVEAISPPLPSQQGSSINKRAAPRCTIMAKNKLPNPGLPSCSHFFNTNYLVLLCACMLMWLCVCLTMCRCV